MTDHELFSVVQLFGDGSYEYVVRNMSADEAMFCFCSTTCSPGALVGTTCRVVLIDQSDCVNVDWIFGKGIFFPTVGDIQAMKKYVQYKPPIWSSD